VQGARPVAQPKQLDSRLGQAHNSVRSSARDGQDSRKTATLPDVPRKFSFSARRKELLDVIFILFDDETGDCARAKRRDFRFESSPKFGCETKQPIRVGCI